jgi:archaellum biogenesis ATPase FlaH
MKKHLCILYLPFCILAAIHLASNFFVKGVEEYHAGWGTLEGDYIAVVYLYVFGSGAFAIYNLVKSYRTTPYPIERTQVLIILYGVIATFSFNLPCIAIQKVFNLSIYPITNLTFLCIAGAIVIAVLKHKLLTVEAAVEPTEIKVKIPFEPVYGNSYLLDSRDSAGTFRIFRTLVSTTPGICITAKHPASLRTRYKIDKTPIVWLSNVVYTDVSVRPERLDFELTYTISKFMNDNKQTVILLDDIEYLITTNGFEKTFEFIKNINDLAAQQSAIILVPRNKHAFIPEYNAMLEGIFDSKVEVDLVPVIKATSTADIKIKPPFTYLLLEPMPKVFYSLISSYDGNKLCFTKTYPNKLKAKYKLQNVPIYWVTEVSATIPSVRPVRLNFEFAQLINEFASAHPRSVVFIDALDILVSANDFDTTYEFLKNISDFTASNDCALVVVTSRQRFKKDEFAKLQKRFDYLIQIGG